MGSGPAQGLLSRLPITLFYCSRCFCRPWAPPHKLEVAFICLSLCILLDYITSLVCFLLSSRCLLPEGHWTKLRQIVNMQFHLLASSFEPPVMHLDQVDWPLLLWLLYRVYSDERIMRLILSYTCWFCSKLLGLHRASIAVLCDVYSATAISCSRAASMVALLLFSSPCSNGWYAIQLFFIPLKVPSPSDLIFKPLPNVSTAFMGVNSHTMLLTISQCFLKILIVNFDFFTER